jgi:AdoMet-dependent heme synthase
MKSEGTYTGNGQPTPRLVSWNVTSACPLRCPHCYIDAGQPVPAGPDELSTSEGRSLIDALALAGTRVLILSGGEPLLRKDILDLVRYGTLKGLRMAIGTSGTLLDWKCAENLKAAGISSVAISLDSLRPSIHDRFRGVQGSWRKAMKGITACLDEEIPIRINTTVSGENFAELGDIVSFGQGLGIHDFQVFFTVPVGRAADSKIPDPERYESMIGEVLEKTARPGISVRPTCVPQFMRIAKEQGFDHPSWSRGCIAGLSYCRICPDGEVTPCPYLPVTGGNVRKTTFSDIWTTSPVFISLRDPKALRGKCGRCEYQNICGGCRARAYGLYVGPRSPCGQFAFQAGKGNDYLGEDPVCTYIPGKRGSVK